MQDRRTATPPGERDFIRVENSTITLGTDFLSFLCPRNCVLSVSVQVAGRGARSENRTEYR